MASTGPAVASGVLRGSLVVIGQNDKNSQDEIYFFNFFRFQKSFFRGFDFSRHRTNFGVPLVAFESQKSKEQVTKNPGANPFPAVLISFFLDLGAMRELEKKWRGRGAAGDRA